MVERYTAICIQQSQFKGTLDHAFELIDGAMHQFGALPMFPPKLLVLPEHFLMTRKLGVRPKKLYGINIPGEETDKMSEKAKQHGVYIAGGVLEADPKYEEALFNTAVLIGPKGKLLLRYRKIFPWSPNDPGMSPHDMLDVYEEPFFPVAKTDIGNIGLHICYDACFPEVTRQLTFNGAEVLVKPTALAGPWSHEPLDWFTVLSRARSIENFAYSVNCNIARPGSGHSVIVDYEGRLLAEAWGGDVEDIIGATIDVDACREFRKTVKMQNMLKDFRSEVFDYLDKTVKAPNQLLSVEARRKHVEDWWAKR
jgi:predicted amidohydrolase